MKKIIKSQVKRTSDDKSKEELQKQETTKWQ